MKKRSLLLLLVLCLMLSGCNSYVSVTPHREQRQSTQTEVPSASNYQELLAALKATIASGTEVAAITVADYPEDMVEFGIQRSILHARYNDPVGAYAVEDIRYELGSSGGVPAVSVTIYYRHGKTEIQRIRTATGVTQAETLTANAVKEYESGLVMLVKDYKERDFAQFVQDYALENPQSVMETPQISQVTYGTGSSRVVELIFTYQTSREDLRRMQSQVKPVFDAATLYVSGDGVDRQKYYQLYAFLMERFDYKLETSITPAYSLLRHGVGDSRAFATVYAAMCRGAGLECLVVTGTRSGEPGSWNMVLDDGKYYHVDLLHESGTYRELTDDEMTGYVWDYTNYPACTGEKVEETLETTP